MLPESAAFAHALAQFPEAGRRLLIDVAAPTGFGGRIAKSDVVLLRRLTGHDEDELLRALLPLARSYARAPVSNFAVGAAALGESGAIHLGANLEFAGASLWNSVHAEQSAIMRAWSAGERGIVAIATSETPCGLCRQFMTELGPAEKLRVIGTRRTYTLAELLPDSFGPANLGARGFLFDAPKRLLALEHASEDPLVIASFQACARSYAPYSGTEAAVGLRLRSGALITGRYAESAAHNPSLSPLAAALSSRVIEGLERDEIIGATLVAVGSAHVDHAAPARALLNIVAPGVRLLLRSARVDRDAAIA
jgi:cytidine deaminase